ncbi:hypothetical protein HOE425_340257 [Hoeflea sp. EC-HK425]|nr:hypothetical protein HOE425_340257 [Hoeflea sp. EC-HK425]
MRIWLANLVGERRRSQRATRLDVQGDCGEGLVAHENEMKMVIPEGFEPSTPGLGILCSIP